MSIQYSDNMSPEDQQKLLAECAATERAYDEAGDMAVEPDSEAASLQELERGYAQDRI